MAKTTDLNTASENPNAVTSELQAVTVAVAPAADLAPVEPIEYAEVVRARSKGHYGEIREVGDVFANDQNLATYPEDPNSWFEDADKPTEEKKAKRR